MKKLSILWLVLLGIIIIAAPCNAQILYTVTDLGTLGGQESSALGVNNYGQVVGYSTVEGGNFGTRHAFYWDSTRGMIDMGILGGSWAAAAGINDSGQAVGISETTDGWIGFTWDLDNGMEPMDIDWQHYSATGINTALSKKMTVNLAL